MAKKSEATMAEVVALVAALLILTPGGWVVCMLLALTVSSCR